MRQSIIDFFQSTILLKYNLPNGSIERSDISTRDDSCYEIISDDCKLSEIIYNSLIDYAFNENEMDSNLNSLHAEAISQRMRIEDSDDEDTQLKYGFFGEVLLNLILRIYYSTNPIIAKGHFYDLLNPEEPKGYDSFHLIEDGTKTQLWFGEVKFHKNYTSAIKSICTNFQKAMSCNYFQKNLLALTPKRKLLNINNPVINRIISDLRSNPSTTILNLRDQYNLQWIYPIFILCDRIESYDETIKSIIKFVNKSFNSALSVTELDCDLFFILMPVSNTIQIKKQVLQWIKLKQPLTLL